MDPKELEKFKYLGDIWWDENGRLKILFALNRLRIPAILENLESIGMIKKQAENNRPLQGLSILDVGCGGGILSEALTRLGAEVVGVDGVEELIFAAREHASRQKGLSGLSYICKPAQELGNEHRAKYDVVIASEVLDHVVDKESLVKISASCLKPGGAIFMSTISQTRMATTFATCVPENILNYINKGVHEYHMFITPEHTATMLKDNNCTTKSVRGMYYDYFKDSWFWLHTPKIWYFLFAVKD